MVKPTLDTGNLKLIALAFAAGILWFVLIRVVTYQSDSTHYHANFGVFINGEREPFDSFAYYEEITACSLDGENPARRAHMHDYVNDVVHVHDNEVAWGHFFANLGWTIDDEVLATRTEVYQDDIVFYLNGQPASNLANRIIQSEDMLIVTVGENPTYDDLASQIDASAAQFNQEADPATCSGELEDDGFASRLRSVLGL